VLRQLEILSQTAPRYLFHNIRMVATLICSQISSTYRIDSPNSRSLGNSWQVPITSRAPNAGKKVEAKGNGGARGKTQITPCLQNRFLPPISNPLTQGFPLGSLPVTGLGHIFF
jgi:hypothetical protein